MEESIQTRQHLFNMDQASEYLNMPKQTLYKLVSAGKIRPAKMTRRNQFRREDLDELIKKSLR